MRLLSGGQKALMELHVRSVQMLGSDQATANRQRAERPGKKSDARCGRPLDAAVRRARLRVPREEPPMSIKSKLLAATATLTLVSAVGAAGALTAGPPARPPRRADPPASTSSASSSARTSRRTSWLTCCGRARRSASRSSCSAPRTTTRPRTSPWRSRARVADFYAAKLVSAAVALHYGGLAAGFPNDPAFENEYAPFGVESGLCLGVAQTAFGAPGRDAAAVRCVREHRVDPGLPGFVEHLFCGGTFR